jgi:hypothetical protein
MAIAPLKSSFLLVAMLGLIASGIYTYFGKIPTDWGFALILIFVLMFIASMVSMTYGPIEPQLDLDKDIQDHPAPDMVSKTQEVSVTPVVAPAVASVAATPRVHAKPKVHVKPKVQNSKSKATKKQVVKKKKK